MFGLFKKKKQQTEALIEKDEHTGSDNGAADIAARTASNQATQIQMQKAAQTFAKPNQANTPAIEICLTAVQLSEMQKCRHLQMDKNL